jgi:hypothetical protein
MTSGEKIEAKLKPSAGAVAGVVLGAPVAGVLDMVIPLR